MGPEGKLSCDDHHRPRTASHASLLLSQRHGPPAPRGGALQDMSTGPLATPVSFPQGHMGRGTVPLPGSAPGATGGGYHSLPGSILPRVTGWRWHAPAPLCQRLRDRDPLQGCTSMPALPPGAQAQGPAQSSRHPPDADGSSPCHEQSQ